MRPRLPRYLKNWRIHTAIGLAVATTVVAVVTGYRVLGAVIVLSVLGIGFTAAYVFESGRHRGRHNGRRMS